MQKQKTELKGLENPQPIHIAKQRKYTLEETSRVSLDSTCQAQAWGQATSSVPQVWAAFLGSGGGATILVGLEDRTSSQRGSFSSLKV